MNSKIKIVEIYDRLIKDNFPVGFITGDRRTEDGNALDEHPSNIAHKTFAKEVVSKWINNT